jgi:hypothetical protein
MNADSNTLDMSGTSHFWSRSVQKQILVPVPVKNILVMVPVQKKHLGPGPVQKKFGAGPGQKNVGPGPVQKKKFGPGTGTTLPISKTHPPTPSINE